MYTQYWVSCLRTLGNKVGPVGITCILGALMEELPMNFPEVAQRFREAAGEVGRRRRVSSACLQESPKSPGCC